MVKGLWLNFRRWKAKEHLRNISFIVFKNEKEVVNFGYLNALK